ncbi:MAG: S1 RNA-binding domain-containing protein, partial [Acinetobacter sp.]|nr:S1 RNA-binding domain-containing protein [Acinetobacter sp.]
TISAVAEFGLFVTLKDLYVDGMIHVSQLGDDYFVYDQPSQSLIGQARGQSFSLGDEVKIKVAAVNLEDRKIDFELLQQLSHGGRPIRSRAPRVGKAKTARSESKEEVFSESTNASPSNSGDQPIRRKKDKSQPSSYSKKPGKKSSSKSETKVKDKVKKKAKLKKKKSNAKAKTE